MQVWYLTVLAFMGAALFVSHPASELERRSIPQVPTMTEGDSASFCTGQGYTNPLVMTATSNLIPNQGLLICSQTGTPANPKQIPVYGIECKQGTFLYISRNAEPGGEAHCLQVLPNSERVVTIPPAQNKRLCVRGAAKIINPPYNQIAAWTTYDKEDTLYEPVNLITDNLADEFAEKRHPGKSAVLEPFEGAQGKGGRWGNFFEACSFNHDPNRSINVHVAFTVAPSKS